MKLFELFDKPTNYQTKDSHGIVDMNATLSDGSILDVEFYKSDTYKGKNGWWLSFTRRAAGEHQWQRSNGKTKMGNEVEVMSTVVDMATKFVNQYKPDTLQFTAEKVFDDPRAMSRANLYKKMAQRLGAGEYEVRMDNTPEAVHFVMVRKGHTPEERTELSDWGDDEID